MDKHSHVPGILVDGDYNKKIACLKENNNWLINGYCQVIDEKFIIENPNENYYKPLLTSDVKDEEFEKAFNFYKDDEKLLYGDDKTPILIPSEIYHYLSNFAKPTFVLFGEERKVIYQIDVTMFLFILLKTYFPTVCSALIYDDVDE